MKIAFITPQGKADYLVETVLEGFHQLGHELIVSDPGNGFCDFPMSANDFVTHANQSDLVIACFGKVRNNAPPRHYLLSQIHQPRERKVYVDGSEWSATGWDTPSQVALSLTDPTHRRGHPWLNENMRKECGFYFKRECYPDDIDRYGVIPLPFALCQRHILEPAEKDIDVFCSFGHTKTGMRREIIEVVEHFARTMDPSADINVVIKSGMSSQEYQDTLRRSRIVIDAWGGGDLCDRFWEGIGSKATVLYQRYNVEFPDPFVDWDQAVSWSTVPELSNALHRLVYSRTEALDIGIKGFEHAKRYHTAASRVKKILDYCHVDSDVTLTR